MIYSNKWCKCTDVVNVSGKFLGFSFLANNNCKTFLILKTTSPYSSYINKVG